MSDERDDTTQQQRPNKLSVRLPVPDALTRAEVLAAREADRTRVVARRQPPKGGAS